MSNPQQLFDALSALLAYPDASFATSLEGRIATIAAGCPEAGKDLEGFASFVVQTNPEELEELYTRTFDNSADRALEVGWHVYGETYDRGAFLVEMRGAMRRVGVTENGELPDHLSHVLAVIGRLEDAEMTQLSQKAERAIAKVAAELAAGKNPYCGVLDATWKLVAEHAKEAMEVRP